MSVPNTLSCSQLLARFKALDALLLKHQQLWRPRPFTQRQLPWETEYPQLATWLRGRTLAEAEAAHNQPELVQAPWPYTELAAQTAELSAVGELPQSALAKRRSRLNAGVPGRKWQQIEAFAGCLQFAQQPRHWLDWCAGKGHLGRLLAHDGAALTCLEHDSDLVAAGQRLSERAGLTVAHKQQDVMADSAAAQLHAEQTPVALHACGDLHIRLLQLASQTGCQQLAVAPCCYNRIGTPSYQALSETAKASALHLSLDDLGLPLSETVTAGARVRRQRDQSMAWRLAFDLLQRQLRGVDTYLSTPSLAPAWLNTSLADYCHHLATLKHLPSPGAQDWQALESQGWQRLAEVRNLELVRGLFRRPLELWLLLDRGLYLQEQGYSVHLGSFCPSQLTPRNLLFLAERP